MSAPRISIVVCTFNGEPTLARCLESVVTQDVAAERFEVVVVDNNSTDATPEVVDSYARSYPNVCSVSERRQGLSHARNRGAAVASAPYLTYVDDDARVPPAFVRRLIEIIDHHDPDIIGGPIYPYFTTPKPRWFRDRYEVREYARSSDFSRTCGVSGSNFTIRRTTLVELGMFDVDLGMKGPEQAFGEDRALLLAYRRAVPPSRQRVYYSLEAFVHHWVPPHKMRLTYLTWRNFAGGRMQVSIGDRATTPADGMREIGRKPLEGARFIGREWWTRGVRRADYPRLLFVAAFQAGVVLEVLRRLPARLVGGGRAPAP